MYALAARRLPGWARGDSVNARAGSVLMSLALVVASCAGSASGADECPETVEEDGMADGIDLPPPDWLPATFPLPDGISLRHHSSSPGLAPQEVLTGFIPGGAADEVVATLRADLARAGYDVLFDAGELLSPSFIALAVLDDALDTLVTIDVAEEELPVRHGDACPWTDGVLVGMSLQTVDPDAARALYSETSLRRGTATAVVGGDEFVVDGVCHAHDGALSFTNPTRSFGPTAPVLVQLDFGLHAVVEVYDGPLYLLADEAVSGVAPMFRVAQDGFAVQGVFFDAQSDEGPVEGSVEVTCG